MHKYVEVLPESVVNLIINDFTLDDAGNYTCISGPLSGMVYLTSLRKNLSRMGDLHVNGLPWPLTTTVTVLLFFVSVMITAIHLAVIPSAVIALVFFFAS